MVTMTTMSAEQLLTMPDDGSRHELIEGALTTMAPAGARHGKVTARITLILARHVDQHQLGTVFGAETGFTIARSPDTVRAPDVAFVASTGVSEIPRGFFDGPPDLAIEVTSPGDSFTEVQKKALSWLRAGCRLVLVADPEQQTVTAWRSSDDIRVLGGDDEVACEDVVAGWRERAAAFFE